MQLGDSFQVTEDRLLGGRVRLSQPAVGYRAAIDPVLLAARIPAKAGDSVLDLGCGVGAAALCLMARIAGVSVIGLELQSELAELARRNGAENGFDAFSVVQGSVLAPPFAPGSFDHVMTNPPYVAAGRGSAPGHGGKRLANMESDADLAAWIKASSRLLKPKGSLTVVHRADRLDELLAAMAGRGLGRIEVFPLWPKWGQAAKRVLVSAVKGARSPLTLAQGLVLHEADGRWTESADAVLRDGGAL